MSKNRWIFQVVSLSITLIVDEEPLLLLLFCTGLRRPVALIFDAAESVMPVNECDTSRFHVCSRRGPGKETTQPANAKRENSKSN
jgi:hypothetical protein